MIDHRRRHTGASPWRAAPGIRAYRGQAHCEYVDRRTAEAAQRERAWGPDGPPTEPEAADGEVVGWLGRLLRRLRGRSSGRSAVVLAVLSLTVTACAGGQAPIADPDDAARAVVDDEPAASEPTSEEPEPAAVIAVCEDDRDDQVVFADGVPTSQEAPEGSASDLVQATLVEDDAGFRISSRRAEGGPPASGGEQLEVHLQALDDPGRTGVVVVRFPSSRDADLEIEVGATLSDLTPVETVGSSVSSTTVSATLTTADLPVAPPFRWFHSIPGDAGDVCPNVTGFTAEADLPTFPSDAEAEPVAADTVEVTGVDYGFEGVPEQVEAGTRLTFTNGSEGEAHELALVRLTDETPPLEEFLRMPPPEGMAVSELVGVSIGLPAEEGRVTKGDLLLDAPGRYILLCPIPVGTPPEQIATHPYGPPPGAPPPDSPPHVARGMVTVIEVSG